MLKALGYDTERKGLHPSLCFILRRAVGEYARQVGDLGDPATVVLSLEFHLERHAASVAIAILAGLVALREVRRTPGISCEGRDLPGPRTMTSRTAAMTDRLPSSTQHPPPFIPLFDRGATIVAPKLGPLAPCQRAPRPTSVDQFRSVSASVEHQG
jgi:hypothetical protein